MHPGMRRPSDTPPRAVSSPCIHALAVALALAPLAGCAPPGGSRVDVGVAYHGLSGTIRVSLSRGLRAGESLHARVRRGAVGALDCAVDASGIDRIDGRPVEGASGPTFVGPAVDEGIFESPYDTAWLEHAEPTAEMLAAAALGEHVIDVCLVREGAVVAQAELDVRRALDRDGEDGKFDDHGDERIASTAAYAERCVAELGEIPFFEPLGDGDYGTYDCLDSVPIPTTVTSPDGTVTHPEEQVAACDEPQYIYSLCEPNAVDGRTNGPRVASRANDRGTHWVLLCRKARQEEGAYNDIAMIGHNPYTGRTCFFQNALYSRTDGLHVPHPGDSVESERSPQRSESLWSGIHGGLGSGIQCARCHDADPFIHTPWIDGALGDDGEPVIPRMGEHDDFALGFNDAPYSIVGLESQGWTMPRHLTSPEADACTRCHRIGDGRWATDWIRRLDGTDAAWRNITTEVYNELDHLLWMPPDLDGVDEQSWPDSEYARAMRFIQDCGRDPSACAWEELPTDQTTDLGELPSVDLQGADLARAALGVLGADIEDPSCPDGNCGTRRCAECHSVSRSGLRRWMRDTDRAWRECRLADDPEAMTPEQARAAIDCLRSDPEDPASVFEAQKLGILTTGVQYGYFRKLFRNAYGEGWLAPYTQFKARVGMPKGNHPKLSQREYATLVAWFEADLVGLEEVLDEPPPPDTCEERYETEAILAHVDAMRFEGWGALNEEAGIRMLGCVDDDPSRCFASGEHADLSATWGRGLGRLRELVRLDFRTSFWTRSSADGRFVGNGGGNGARSTMTDLLTGRSIAVDAAYDPGFFPDNSGFIFQGATGGAGVCAQSLLSTTDHVTFQEPQCTTARGINLYQHVARGLGGGDYFVINSQFTSDSGTSATQDPAASFNASSTIKITPMIFDGTTFAPRSPVIVDSPYEGDSVLSPSGRLVASRLAGPEGRSLGYVVRRVVTERFGDTYRVDTSERLATVCMSGAKPSFSFEERFFVTHHYEGDRANVYLVDLFDGARHPVTDMPAGWRALFPHFRSDGWLYFLVHGPDGERVMVASDAAVELSK